MSKQASLPDINAPVIAIMLFQVAALFCRSFLQRELVAHGLDQEFAINLSYLVVPVIEIVLLWPILRQNWQPLKNLLRLPDQWPRQILYAALLGLMARLCGWSVLISAAAFGWFEFSPPGQGNGPWFWFACPPPTALLLALFASVILIPPGEEIINRGLIFGNLRKSNRNRAILLSAALFAVMHNPDGMIAAFAIGILLAIQTLKAGSLVPSIVTHATYNLLKIVDWNCLHSVWNPEMQTPVTTAVGTASIVIGILALGIAIHLAIHAGPGQKARPDPGH